MATATSTEKLASELVNIIKRLEAERDKLDNVWDDRATTVVYA